MGGWTSLTLVVVQAGLCRDTILLHPIAGQTALKCREVEWVDIAALYLGREQTALFLMERQLLRECHGVRFPWDRCLLGPFQEVGSSHTVPHCPLWLVTKHVQ